jgi:hypothetical protein
VESFEALNKLPAGMAETLNLSGDNVNIIYYQVSNIIDGAVCYGRVTRKYQTLHMHLLRMRLEPQNATPWGSPSGK